MKSQTPATLHKRLRRLCLTRLHKPSLISRKAVGKQFPFFNPFLPHLLSLVSLSCPAQKDFIKEKQFILFMVTSQWQTPLGAGPKLQIPLLNIELMSRLQQAS